MPDSALRAPSPSPRGVHTLDFLSLHGHLIVVAISSQNRRVAFAEVSPNGDEQGTRADLMAILDTVDPLPVEPRPMRLVRAPARMSPALSIGLSRIAARRTPPR